MQKLINLYRNLSNKSYSTLAGSIAFFLIINGGSVFFLVINICNRMGYDVFNYFDTSYLPNQLAKIIDVMYTDTLSSSFSFFYIITSIISGSTLFYHLIKVTEIIYNEKLANTNILNRILSIFLVIVFLILIVLLFVSFLIINLITKESSLNIVFKYSTMILIPFIILFFINKVVTPKNHKLKDIIVGVLFATSFWFIVTIGFNIFLNIFSNYKGSYGTLSFFIVFMIWIYLLSQGLIIGIITNYNISINVIKKQKITMAHKKEVT